MVGKTSGQSRPGCSKMQLGSSRKHLAFSSIAVEQVQTFQARLVEGIVNVGCEVVSHILFADTQLGCPRFRDAVEVFGEQAMIARFLKNSGEIEIGLAERLVAYRPEGEDERLAGDADPFFGQVPGSVPGTIYLERGIADQECSIGLMKHFLQMGRSRRVASIPAPELFKQDANQGHRGQGRAIERDRADFVQWFFTNQKNRANRLPGSNGYAGQNRKIGTVA